MNSEKGKRLRKPKPTFSRLYDTFVGNVVTIIVKNVKGYGGTAAKVSNLMFAGYMLDECDEYIYVGQTADSVSAAIKKDEIATVVLGDTLDQEDIELPEGSEMQ